MSDTIVVVDDKSPSEIIQSWNSGEEDLLAGIADRCNCMRWMHEKSEIRYEKFNFYLTIPSILLSTVSGTATIGIQSLTNYKTEISIVVGVTTLSIGMLTSLNQYMKSSQFAEAHRAASIAYGKLHRLISSELAMRRDQRKEAQGFLLHVRTEQDRLQEISPGIPDSVIQEFKQVFKNKEGLELPEIVGDLEHVTINKSTKEGDLFSTPK